jgi:hypothetical protein
MPEGGNLAWLGAALWLRRERALCAARPALGLTSNVHTHDCEQQPSPSSHLASKAGLMAWSRPTTLPSGCTLDQGLRQLAPVQ